MKVAATFLRFSVSLVLIFITGILQAQEDNTSPIPFRFQVILGTSLSQPMEFVGTDEIQGVIARPGYAFGVGLLYDKSKRFSFSGRFIFNRPVQNISEHIHYDMDSYVFQNIGISEYKSSNQFGLQTFFSTTAYEVGINMHYNFFSGRHEFGPTAGLNIQSVESLFHRSRKSIENDDEVFLLSEVFFLNKAVNKVGVDLGVSYRFELRNGNALFFDLLANLYFNHEYDDAYWRIWGKHPDPNISESGDVKRSFNRLSLNFGYAF